MVNQSNTSTTLQTLVPFGGYGPRVALHGVENPVSTLVIGVGQVGWHAATLLHRMISATYTPKSLSRTQFFVVARRPPVIPEDRLSRDYCLLLNLEETKWEHIPGHYSGAGVARWWPKPPRDLEKMPDNNNIRAYGRLLLFDNATLVHDTLGQRTSQLVQESTHSGADGRKQVIFLASIAEAEGSGLLFDLNALLRTQLSDHATTFTAIVSADVDKLPEAERPLAMANTYATIKELDAMMMNPTHFQLGPPVADHTRKLAALGAKRPFDYFLITGDTTVDQEYPPAAATITEMAASWMTLFMKKPELPLPPVPPTTPRQDRFDGYTTFNISKLGLPTGAAMDVVASRVAEQVLIGMVSQDALDSVSDWVRATLLALQQIMFIDTLLEEPKVYTRLHSLLQHSSPEVLTQEISRYKDRTDFNLRQFADAWLRKLEIENRITDLMGDGQTEYRLDTLRSRAEEVLDAAVRKSEQYLSGLATQLACVQGRSLRWIIEAIEKLRFQMNTMLNEYRQRTIDADYQWQAARRQMLVTSQEYDDRFNGIKRLLRGVVGKELTEILDTYHQANQSMVELIRWTVLSTSWARLWNGLDQAQSEVRIVLQQVERAAQIVADYGNTTRAMIGTAAQQATLAFPAGTLVDSEWFKQGVARASQINDTPTERLIPRIYRQWSAGRVGSEQRIDRFLRDLLPACRKYLGAAFDFAQLRSYLIAHMDAPIVQRAIADFQRVSIPLWVPEADLSSTWTAHEWLRREKNNSAQGEVFSLLRPVGEDIWQRRDILSPDPDEVCMIRLVHRITAESVEQLRNPYRRAYERIAADGIPLHIDRRWDDTLADLIRNNVRAESSTVWEMALQAALQGPVAMRAPLTNLVQSLAVALGIDPKLVQRIQIPYNDFALTVFPLPTFPLLLPPPQCPIIFNYSNRRPKELGQSMFETLTGLSLAEPFVFIVNVNNRKDMDAVVETLHDESYNVIQLDEAAFKGIVGARQPLSMLSEIVVSSVDLTLISPFYTKAPVPERMFFGREREIKDVRRKIRTHSVALIGGRRIGKTSTLQQLERQMKVPESNYVPYYLDCHNAMTYTHFFSAIARRWKIQTSTPDPTCFEDIVTEIRARHGNQQIVFLFDEVDRLLMTDQEQAHSELLFRTFRSLSNENRCKFIFSGERWLARAMEDSFSALFNFTEPVRLAPLEKPVVSRLVREPFEKMNIWLENAPELIGHIYEVSAGHPNIVQMICQEMIVAIDSDKSNMNLLNRRHLEMALSKHKLQQDIVETFWGQMSELAKLITLLWPETERSLELEQIMARVQAAGLKRVTVQDLKDAMKDLDLYCFVAPKGRAFELIPVDFPILLDEMISRNLEINNLVTAIISPPKQQHADSRSAGFFT